MGLKKLKKAAALLTSVVMGAALFTYAPLTGYADTVFVSNNFDTDYEGWYNYDGYSDIEAVAGGYSSARAMLAYGGAEAQKGYYITGGVKYNYSVKVKVPDNGEVALQIRYLYEDTEEYGYQTIDTAKSKGEWVTLEGKFSAPAGTVNLSPILTEKNGKEFLFDDFKVTGKKPLTAHAAQGDDGLKDIYAKYFRVGTCIPSNGVNNNTYKAIILKHFNSITPENELKPDSIIDFNNSTDTNVAVRLNNAATIIDFCVKNNIAMRGHTLVWHSQTPGRLFKTGYSDNGSAVSTTTMDQRMESMIKNTFSAIKSQYPSLNIYAYDVVNEAMSDSNWGSTSNDWVKNARPAGYYSNGDDQSGSGWVSVYGDNKFIEKAFAYASKYRDQYLPGMSLFYNDYNEYAPIKKATITKMANDLKTKGLDGIGMQSHLSGSGSQYPTSTADYKSTFEAFVKTGVEVQITELDIQGSNADNISSFYKSVFEQAVNHKKAGYNFTALVVWGTTQQSSWRGNNNPYILLFNNDGTGNSNLSAVNGTNIVPQADWGDGDNPVGSTPSGPVTPPEPINPDKDGYYWYDTFETNTGDWEGRGAAAIARVTTNKYEGTAAGSVTGRTATWNGTSHALNSRAFFADKTYSFGTAVYYDGANAPAEVKFNLSLLHQLSDKDGDQYATIASVTAKKGEWTILENTAYKLPATMEDGAAVYVETEYFEDADNPDAFKGNFLIDNAYGAAEGVTPFKTQQGGTTTTPAKTTTTTPAPTTTTPAPTTTNTPLTTVTTVTTTLTTAPTTTNGGSRIESLGDIDGNGVVNIADVVTLAKNLNKSTLTATQKANADVDGNGAVNVTDLLLIIKFVFGEINSF